MPVTRKAATRLKIFILNLYFEDFFCMYCLIMAAAFPTTSFEGMLRMDSPGTYAKRILTHAVYDRSSLDFEQLEGNPVYHSIILSWVRSDHRLVKRKMSFPAFHVSILADDREAVRQDEEIDQWIRSVNDVEMELRPRSHARSLFQRTLHKISARSPCPAGRQGIQDKAFQPLVRAGPQGDPHGNPRQCDLHR